MTTGDTDMADFDFQDVFLTDPFVHADGEVSLQHEYDLCSSSFLGLQTAQPNQAHAEYWAEIEHIYFELHRSVDQILSRLPLDSTLRRRNGFIEQNRKLIAKLKCLDMAITEAETIPTSPPDELSSLNFSCTSSPSSEAANVESNLDAPATTGISTSSEVRGLWNAGSDVGNGAAGFGDLIHQNIDAGRPNLSPTTSKHSSRLAKKLLLVGNEEARIQVVEFASQLHLPTAEVELLDCPTISGMTNAPSFLKFVIHLGREIESSTFGEQKLRIQRRIALARFYRAYSLAQEQPKLFLSWCDSQHLHDSSIYPKGGSKSLVQKSFASLIFSRDVQRGGGTPKTRHPTNGGTLKRRVAKIQMWRKIGKKWAQFIQRFGYGILLLLPSSLSDEEWVSPSSQ